MSAYNVIRNQVPLVRAIGWTLSGEVSSKAATLVATVVSARVLSPEEFSLFIGFQAAVLLASAATDAGLSQLSVKELAAGRISAREMIRSVVRLKLVVLPLLGFAFLALVGVLGRGSDLRMSWIALFGIAALIIYIHMPILAVLKGQHRFRSVSLCTALGRWITASLIIVAALGLSGSADLFELAVATVTGELAILILGLYLISPGSFWNERSEAASAITLRRALPFASSSILAIAYNRLDVILVAALVSMSEYSRYAPASRIQDALFIFPTAISAAAFPIFSRSYGDQRGRNATAGTLRFMALGGLALAMPLALVLTVFAPQLIGLILGSGYESSIPPVRILIWSLPFAIVCSPLLAILAASDRPKYATIVFAAAFGTAFVMQLLLARPFGANGAALASLARDPVSVIVAFLLVRRVTGAMEKD